MRVTTKPYLTVSHNGALPPFLTDERISQTACEDLKSIYPIGPFIDLAQENIYDDTSFYRTMIFYDVLQYLRKEGRNWFLRILFSKRWCGTTKSPFLEWSSWAKTSTWSIRGRRLKMRPMPSWRRSASLPATPCENMLWTVSQSPVNMRSYSIERGLRERRWEPPRCSPNRSQCSACRCRAAFSTLSRCSWTPWTWTATRAWRTWSGLIRVITAVLAFFNHFIGIFRQLTDNSMFSSPAYYEDFQEVQDFNPSVLQKFFALVLSGMSAKKWRVSVDCCSLFCCFCRFK